MNLRSGSTVDKLPAKKSKKRAQRHQPGQVTMAEYAELKSLVVDMKDSLLKDLNAFRNDFKDFRAETEKDIKSIMQQNGQLREDLEKATSRLEQVEHRVGKFLNAEIIHHKAIEQLANKITDLEERTEYLENKSRQNNMHISNVPEKSEGSDMIAFLKKLFCDTLQISGDIEIIRAHRIYREDRRNGRPIVVAFKDYDTKNVSLQRRGRRRKLLTTAHVSSLIMISQPK